MRLQQYVDFDRDGLIIVLNTQRHMENYMEFHGNKIIFNIISTNRFLKTYYIVSV